MKHHLKRVIGDSTLTFEELSTLVYQIEACLNSRPLCALTDDINDVTPLTAGHFLIGRELLTPTSPVVAAYDTNLSDRWKLIQKMKKDFWQVWSTEYLHQLQQRYKWKTRKDNITPGDMVIIKEDNINPSKWPLAKVKEVHPSTDGLTRVVTIQKAGGATMKRSIHKLIPLPKNEDKEQPPLSQHAANISTAIKSPKSTNKWRIVFLAILFISNLSDASKHLYEVKYPKPGFYIEHIGHTKVSRGEFRTELKFEKIRLINDTENIMATINQVDNLCKESTKLSADIQCAHLVHHLREKEKQVEWMKKGLDRIMSEKRTKRGLLGELMTSIFGVNDEVYKDIDTLDKNQRELIRASNHQTKFMLQALSRFNETEVKVDNRLNSFRAKLNQGLEAINNMNKWYSTVDHNKLKIHLLSAYQLAANYIDELIEYYRKLLEVHFNTAYLYEFITPAHVEEIIEEASRKLPSNIHIESYPILKTEVKHSENYMHIFAYFAMTEVNEFILVKVTPLPFKIEENKYWLLKIKADMLAIDYNTQQFFEMTEEELHSSIQLNKSLYISSPAVIYNIENTPNCIINEIYQRNDKTTCETQEKKLHSIIWKQLYTKNTWLFISPEVIRVAVTCNGIREDVVLNKTGIISISQSCVITTKNNVLTPRRLDTISVLAAYTKPVAVNLTTSKLQEEKIFQQIPKETVISTASKLNDLVEGEENINDELQDTTWKRIKHHSVTANIITGVAVVGLIVILWGTQELIRKKPWKKTSNRREKKEEAEMIELNPIYHLATES